MIAIVSLADFGFDPCDLTGVANHAAFVAALNHLKAAKGGVLVVPGVEFWVSQTVKDRDFPYNLAIIGLPGNKIKAVDGFVRQIIELSPRRIHYQIDVPVPTGAEDLWFNKAVTDPALGVGHRWDGTQWVVDPTLDGRSIYFPATLITDNLNFDCSRGATVDDGQKCSAIVAPHWKYWFAQRNTGFGGTVCGQTGADSFLSPVACWYFHFKDNHIQGFSDCAYYVGGDNKVGGASGDGFSGLIEGGTVMDCQAIVASKRELGCVHIRNIDGMRNYAGFLTLQVGSGLAGAGREMHISGCRLLYTQSRCVEFRDNSTGTVRGNIFRDGGYNVAANNGSVVTGHASILINGGYDVEVSNNVFERVRVQRAGQVAISVANSLRDNVTHIGGRLKGKGNTYRNIARILVEGQNIRPNRLSDETLEDMGVNFSPQTWFITTNANTVVQYNISGDPISHIRHNGANLKMATVPL